MFVRRDFWSMEAADPWNATALAYEKAVGAMRARPANDPTSWAYQAAIHGSYANPALPNWNECQHGTWFFLPWHRTFIYFFERIVRAAVIQAGGPADWALPYWNYENGYPSNTIPPAFRTPRKPDGTANQLYAVQRASGINTGAQLPPSAISSAAARALTRFTGVTPRGFGGGITPPIHFARSTGELENQPHNVIHDLVGGPTASACGGGWMSDPNCAAQDPIFWMHHANIDRIWNRWIGQGGGRINPTDPSWLNQSYTFFDETGKSVTMKSSDVLDTSTQLNYIYDDQTPKVATPPIATQGIATPVAVGGGGPMELLAASGPVTLSGTRVTLDIPTDAPTHASIMASAGPTSNHPLSLDVEGVEAEGNPGIVYQVFLNLPAGADVNDPQTYHDHFVGHITFFGANHQPADGDAHGGPPGLRHTFEVTDLVQHLQQLGDWDPANIRVTIEPLGLMPPPGGRLEPEVRARPTARIGRVSIFRS